MKRVLWALALLLTSCGGGNGHDHGGKTTPTIAGAREVTVQARNFEFEPKTITVKAGEPITIVLVSEDALHDFTAEGAHASATKGETARTGLNLDKAGRLTFYCSVAGHRGQGMEGTIVVEPDDRP